MMKRYSAPNAKADGWRTPCGKIRAIHSASSALATREQEAIERLTRWLDWQRDHAAALDALQQAERAYHRTVSGSAFTSPTEGPTAVEIQRDALAAVEAARVKLDGVRARKPEP